MKGNRVAIGVRNARWGALKLLFFKGTNKYESCEMMTEMKADRYKHLCEL